MWNRWFRITQGDIDTVQEKHIHAILSWPVLRTGVHGFEKNMGVDLFKADLFPSLYVDFLFTDSHDKDTARFEKIKVHRTVSDWNIGFIRQCWRYHHSGEASVGQQMDSRYTSAEQNNKGHSFSSSLLCHVTLGNTYISNTHTLRCAD